MDAHPGIASVASLLGDPTRSLILFALMDGRALTVSELAEAAAVTLQTASGHLAKLHHANLVEIERQGRHHYFRLAGPEVGQVLEGLMGLAERQVRPKRIIGPREPALRRARVCYDHLAGECAVALLDGMRNRQFVTGLRTLKLTAAGRRHLLAFGINVDQLSVSRRPLCRACLDWSERRHHLAGALGAALLERLIELRWVKRSADRVIEVTPRGAAGFAEQFT
jgi:DNA-binding transcriptional ArsR family regulator